MGMFSNEKKSNVSDDSKNSAPFGAPPLPPVRSAPVRPLPSSLPPLPDDLKPFDAPISKPAGSSINISIQNMPAASAQTHSMPQMNAPVNNPNNPAHLSGSMPPNPPLPSMAPAPSSIAQKPVASRPDSMAELSALEKIRVTESTRITPDQKEVRRRISQVKGPVFISLERYKEVKSLLYSLKSNSQSLRNMMSEFKDNRDQGRDLLNKSVDKLETIEEDIENINSTLRT